MAWRPPGWEPAAEPEPVPAETYAQRKARRAAEERVKREEASKANKAAWTGGRAPHVEEGFRSHVARQRLVRDAEKAFAVPPVTGRVPNPRLMSDAQLAEMVQALARADRYDWPANARPEQLEPADYRTWLIMAGRGWGKSRCGAETVRKWCTESGPPKRIAVIAKGHKELRDVCFEGVSGLLNVFPADEIKRYAKGLGMNQLDLANGSQIFGFSSAEPGSLRGPAFDAAWGDETAAWPRFTAQETLDMLWMTLRESKNPRVVLTTTPKRVEHILDIVKRERAGDTGIVITRGKTIDNIKNLGASALAELDARYSGTRLGAQELSGELLEDVEGALWTEEMLEAARWEGPVPPFKRVITAIDPSGSATGDATGIVTIGYDDKSRIFVLECRSTQGLAAHRYNEAVRSAVRWNAQAVSIEYNYGGDNAALGFEGQWDHLLEIGEITMGRPQVLKSTLRGDKAVKASPVAALYEQQMNTGVQRIFHLPGTMTNGMDALESQLMAWEPGDKKSPNSLDALVVGVRRAMQELGWEPAANSAPKRRRINRGY